ncbi:beta-phosphoglucomutase [Mycolicibacterium aromaticivorans JS19b1 = JCM 16368]|uniref:Beta-phosphoglucomutase n=2 Tax=Mycobacteriaceae TaxID=1762 RepID=A0A064C921_9MYCO|nr:beta-phosphoglucomutase [Mycolicibacterium aromaticivorans JS19b1 = JCM 16368]
MDGVVTDTATVHAAAWKTLFDEVLDELAATPVPSFDVEADYLRYVDGRPREDGVRTFLASRGITLAEGSPDDPPQRLTVQGLAARKQQLFNEHLARDGVAAFPSTVALLRRLRAEAISTALVTSSRNSVAVLQAAGVIDLFDARVDGSDALRLSLPGKPDPATFLEAARRLRVDPTRAVVVEDAEAGVRAGTAGGFGLVVGVDRVGNRAALLAAGAHIVVEDLAALDVDVPIADLGEHWCGGASCAEGPWLLTYHGFDPALEGTREALCTLGNGYRGTRGSAPGSTADNVHYPGTYLAGVFNRLRSNLGGRVVEYEHLVNCPDWTALTVSPPGEAPYRHGSAQMLSSWQQLDLRRGLLTRVFRYRDTAGRTTRVTHRSFVHLMQTNLGVLETTVEAEDWSGRIIVRSGIDGRIANRNVAEYRLLAHEHLLPVAAREIDPESVLLDAVTSQSGVHIAMAARTRVMDAAQNSDTDAKRQVIDQPGYIGHELVLAVRAGQPVTVEKVVAVATSRDRAVSTAALSAAARVRRAPSAQELLSTHEASWSQTWDRFGIELRAGQRQSLALNLNTFHVLQAIAAAGLDLDTGVPARGLHGEGYRGHVFWDEMFVYPMLTMRRPEMTRSLLYYRHRRLDEARAAARAAGLDGAMFPWQSGSDGREETPNELYNPRTGTWMPDNSHRQRHVGLAVAYSVWQYFQATTDLAFLIDAGAELMVEVTRLFASMATCDAADDRFDITGVMGPDEFHDGHPDAPGQGLRNNAYTNVMVAWLITRTLEALDQIAGKDCGPIWDRLALRSGERDHWERIRHRLRVPFHADGVISQFEGYEQLAEFDWQAYRSRYGDLGRLDLILAAEGDSPNRYRLCKQADVLMLLYLLSAEELRAVLGELGYPFPAEAVLRTVEFYLARTTHGSTLSRLVHSWVMARSNRPQSWSLFTRALDSDLADIQGGTTREGVHVGAMAGTVDMVLRCYAGLETRNGMLWLHPVLPIELPRAGFTIVYHGQPISVEVTREQVTLRLHDHVGEPTTVCVEGQVVTLSPGDVHVVALAVTSPGVHPSTGSHRHRPGSEVSNAAGVRRATP